MSVGNEPGNEDTMFTLQRINDGAYYRTPRSPVAHFGTTLDLARATTWTDTKIPERICNRLAAKGDGYWRVVSATVQ